MAQLMVNGINLAYEVQGDGPALLFIHGLGSCLQDWEFQAAAFSQRYKVISFDLRGHGQSDKPAGPYSIKLFADDAAALLKALNVASAHVVGISMGGGVAFQLAVDHPELVTTLTIVNSGPEAVIKTFKEKFAIWMRKYVVRKKGMAKLAELIAPRIFPQPENKAIREAFAERLAKNDPTAYLHAIDALVGWSVLPRIGAIACPVLIIAADRDYTPVSFKQAYVGKMPNARLEVVADSHHALPMEKPAAFNAVLDKFLAEQPAAAAPAAAA